MRHLFTVLAIGLSLAYWHSLNPYSFYMEDSWLLRQEYFSLFDFLHWLVIPRDPWGYFRPVRRLFFALMGESVRPREYFLVLWFFWAATLGLLAGVLRFHRVTWAISLGIILIFGSSELHRNGLLWLSASHNIFALCFFMAALLCCLKQKLELSFFFLFLALGSRETIMLTLPLLGVYAFWNANEHRKWFVAGLVALALYGVVVFTSGELPPYIHSGEGAGHLWLVLNSWTRFLATFIWSDLDQVAKTEFSYPSLLLAASIWLVGFVWAIKWGKQKKTEAIYLGLFLCGATVHWVYPENWQLEYYSFCLLGFYLLLALLWKNRNLLFRTLLVVFLLWQLALVSWRAERIETRFTFLAEQKRSWLEGFSSIGKNRKPEEILVVDSTTHFDEDPYTMGAGLVYLPHAPELKGADQVILWNLERRPFFGQTWGTGTRRWIFAEPSKNLGGALAVHVREGGGVWEETKREKIISEPLPHGHPPSR